MKIITNNVPRPLLSGWELSDKERRELDYIAKFDDKEAWYETHNQFFRYRGNIYDVNEFVRIVPLANAVGFQHGVSNDSPLLGWDGIQTDSYFSGVVIRYKPDSEYSEIIVGLALS